MLALSLATTTPEPPPPRFVPPLVHAAALMTAMRTTEWFLWPHPFAETEGFLPQWKDSLTHAPRFDPSRRAFEWDGDRWWINVVGHTLFGSELHLRARQCDFGVLGALAWTASASAVWEYAFEGNGVRPSALDLVWTPLSGLALGEARLGLFRLAGRSGTWSSVARALIDPLGGIDHLATGHACGW